MLKVGCESGCLTVISDDFQANHKKIIESIRPLAEQEWLRFDARSRMWDTFAGYYALNKVESKAFDNKSNMPDSFIEKYYNTTLQKSAWYGMLNKVPDILWHQKNPNTVSDLKDALLERNVYEVECNICKKHHFMDEKSIMCTKRRSCIGAACLSCSLSNKVCNYNNLCVENDNSTALQVLNTQLASIEDIVSPLSYYGGIYSDLKVSYISDIHLLHHLPGNGLFNDALIKSLIHTTVKHLYETMNSCGAIVFAGDISSQANVTIQFYKAFVKYSDYLKFKHEKKKLLYIQGRHQQLDGDKDKLETKVERLKQYVKMLERYIALFLDFNIVIQYKNRYHVSDSWVDTITAYKAVKSYVSKGVSKECNPSLELIACKLDLLSSYESRYIEFMGSYETHKQHVHELEAEHNKPLKDLAIKDVYTEHLLLSESRNIFAVLGNHEYMGFWSVQNAVRYFEDELNQLGIKLLHNGYSTLDNLGKHCILFGGTGFAKYNKNYNADTLKCCDNFTRDIEINETTLFEHEYNKAKQVAKDKNACFICISHYPAQDCLGHIDSDTIYFYGHNHQNFYHRNEYEMIYADNQIGYKNSNIDFKVMTTGVETNPYFALGDGLYETIISDYLQFYRYLGEDIGDGSLLYQRCQNDKASMYVIKRKGYYGFFVVNKNKGVSEGISIVDGGRTKKITKSTDLQWVFDNFLVVLSKYLQALAPLRKAQEQISKELKALGLSGSIHGCIVDIDYVHHIMVNPVDGAMTYYYSSAFGLVQILSSFESIIVSMAQKASEDVVYSFLKRDYAVLQMKFNEMKNNSTCLLGNGTELLSEPLFELDVEEEDVSCSEGMYGASRKINTLQRLFSGHTLRAFDLKLVAAQPAFETIRLNQSGGDL